MSRLRLGVIGAGSWAVAAHLPALAVRPEVEFVAVCRKGTDALARVQERFGFAHASEDYRDVLAAGVDLCVVASPSALHHEHVLAALDASAHVLCEKPMTIDPTHAWDLVHAAERADRQLLISFGWNYSPMITAAKRMVEEHGGVGRLEHLTIAMSSATRELLSNTGAYPDASPESVPDPRTWTDPARSGGGYGQAQLSHALGLALHLVDERVAAAYALMSAPLAAPVELHDAITLRFDGGGVGVLSGGSAHRGAGANKHALEVRAIGDAGQLLVDVEREIAWLYRSDGVDVQVPVHAGDGAYDGQGPANALVDVALGNLDQNRAPGELGARTVEALDLAYRSARTGALAER